MDKLSEGGLECVGIGMVKQAKILAQVWNLRRIFLPYRYLQSVLTMKYIIVKSRIKPAINFLSSCFLFRHLLRW